MSQNSQPSTADGLPARLSGPWAREKLTYLQKYMGIVTTGMKNRWSVIYLDLMAGPGRCVVQRTGEEFDGSPVLALNQRDPFSSIVLVEADASLIPALRARVGEEAVVINGDCNDPEVIAELRSHLGHNKLGLAFVDNLGLDVPLATLETLSRGEKVDLFITFQLIDLKRNLGRALEGHDSERWTAFFGSEKWRDAAGEAERKNLSPGETATILMDFYGTQLQRLGYDAIGHSRVVMRNSRNGELYRIILAGKDAKATEFFEKISRIDPGGQRRLPGW